MWRALPGKTAYYSHIYGVKILWCHYDQRNLLQPLSSALKMVVAGLTKRKVYLYRNKLQHVPSNTVVFISSWVFAIAMFFLFHVVGCPEDNLLNFCCVRCKCHRYNMYVSTYFFVFHCLELLRHMGGTVRERETGNITIRCKYNRERSAVNKYARAMYQEAKLGKSSNSQSGKEL